MTIARMAKILVALCFASLPAAAVELAVGDLVVSDPYDDQILRIDPVTGVQELITEGGNLDEALGIAIAPDGMIWAANFGDGKLVEIDPADGSQHVVVLGTITAPRDIEVASDGTLWIVGAKLWRVTRLGSSYVVDVMSEDLEGYGPGQSLAYLDAPSIPDGIVFIAAGSNGALYYDGATDVLEPWGVLPQPAKASVNGVDLSFGLPLFTQSLFDTDLFECDSTVAGLYSGADSLLVITQGAPFTCPRRLAGTKSADYDQSTNTGSLIWYVTDVKLFDAATPPRVIRAEFPIDLSPGSQTIASQGNLLDDPWDIEIVPEPIGGGLAALVGLIALSGVRGAST